MSLSALGPVVGATALLVGRQAVQALHDSLSFAAALAAPGASDAEPAAPAACEDCPPDEEDLEAALQRMADRLRQELAARGVDLSQPIRLQAGITGSIEADGAHPDRAAIEQLFAENASLAAELQELLSRTRDGVLEIA